MSLIFKLGQGLIFFIFMLTIPVCLMAQDKLAGNVIDSLSQEPLPDATVSLAGSGSSIVSVASNKKGDFIFSNLSPEKLLLEGPIGLEDYRTFVPYQSMADDYKTELKTFYASVKKYYQGSYFYSWKPGYEWLVAIGANVSKSADFPREAMVAAMTYEMIYEQPVCYEFGSIKVSTVLFIGKQDNTIVGKALLSPEMQAQHGQYEV